jgi:hypothetical protein
MKREIVLDNMVTINEYSDLLNRLEDSGWILAGETTNSTGQIVILLEKYKETIEDIDQ